MLNYKYILAAGTAMLIPVTVAADTCSTLPKCADIGFTYTADDCGTLKKLKCPFGDAYFCSGSNCKSVSLNANTEVCTKYCEEDKNVCVEKRPMTCSELLSKNNCTRYNNGSTISGTISRDICLFGTVKQSTSWNSTPDFTQMSAWDAGLRWPACESEMTGRAKLDLGSIKITNYANFYTDVEIDNITYAPNGNSWHAYFHGNTKIHVNWSSSRSWTGSLSLYFDGEYDNPTHNEVSITCEAAGSRWTPSTCITDINAYYADVSYCGDVNSSSSLGCDDGSGSDTCYGENEITCSNETDGEGGSCQEDNSVFRCGYY